MDIINCMCRYPYHIGRQHESLPPTMPTGVSLKYQLLPQVRLDTRTLGHQDTVRGQIPDSCLQS